MSAEEDKVFFIESQGDRLPSNNTVQQPDWMRFETKPAKINSWKNPASRAAATVDYFTTALPPVTEAV